MSGAILPEQVMRALLRPPGQAVQLPALDVSGAIPGTHAIDRHVFRAAPCGTGGESRYDRYGPQARGNVP